MKTNLASLKTKIDKLDIDKRRGRGSFSFPGFGLGPNVLIFAVDMSSSRKLIIGKNTFWFGVNVQCKGWNIH